MIYVSYVMIHDLCVLKFKRNKQTNTMYVCLLLITYDLWIMAFASHLTQPNSIM